MSTTFDIPPRASDKIKPFRAHATDEQLEELKLLIKLSHIAPAVFENDRGNEDREWGTPRQWLVDAKEYWLNEFDWRAHEEYINSFPNFLISVDDEVGGHFNVHVAALFSKKADAVPIVMMHGWPGPSNCREHQLHFSYSNLNM